MPSNLSAKCVYITDGGRKVEVEEDESRMEKRPERGECTSKE